MFRVVGLFAGIGGFEAGFSHMGNKTILLCENDERASTVLERRFPGIPLHGNISTLKSLPKDAEVVCAGFPCQNLSMAGNKTGIAGFKSHIIKEMFRLLKTHRTPYVVIENVYFMLHLAQGAGIRNVVNNLEELGYKWAYRVVDSRGFGLAQRRRRVFIVAATEADPRDILLSDDEPEQVWPEPCTSRPIGFYWTEGKSGHGLTGNAIPPIKSGSGLAIPSAPAVLLPNGRVVSLPISVAERLQGFDAGWTSPLKRKGMDRHRWHLIGNAVSVPVSSWISERLSKPGVYDPTNDVRLDGAASWPKAAWNTGKDRHVSSVSEYPLKRRRGNLSSFKTQDWPDLSERALGGFLRRAKDSRLRYPSGFLQALETELLKRR